MWFAVIGGTVLDRALGPVVALATLGPASRAAPGDADAALAVFCTGVVIAPRWVLTAGHCVSIGEGEDRVIAWGTDLLEGEPADTRGWTDAVTHPEADDVDHDHDLGLVQLDADAPSDVVALASVPPAVGDELAFYGFGNTSEGGTDLGVKRGTHLEVLSVEPFVFRSFAPGTNVCSGDSGGPAVAEVDDGWWVAGIDTFVDPNCLGGSAGSTRLDVHLDWLAEVAGELRLDPIEPARSSPREGGCATVSGGLAAAVVALALSRRRRPVRHVRRRRT